MLSSTVLSRVEATVGWDEPTANCANSEGELELELLAVRERREGWKRVAGFSLTSESDLCSGKLVRSD